MGHAFVDFPNTVSLLAAIWPDGDNQTKNNEPETVYGAAQVGGERILKERTVFEGECRRRRMIRQDATIRSRALAAKKGF